MHLDQTRTCHHQDAGEPHGDGRPPPGSDRFLQEDDRQHRDEQRRQKLDRDGFHQLQITQRQEVQPRTQRQQPRPHKLRHRPRSAPSRAGPPRIEEHHREGEVDGIAEPDHLDRRHALTAEFRQRVQEAEQGDGRDDKADPLKMLAADKGGIVFDCLCFRHAHDPSGRGMTPETAGGN